MFSKASPDHKRTSDLSSTNAPYVSKWTRSCGTPQDLASSFELPSNGSRSSYRFAPPLISCGPRTRHTTTRLSNFASARAESGEDESWVRSSLHSRSVASWQSTYPGSRSRKIINPIESVGGSCGQSSTHPPQSRFRRPSAGAFGTTKWEARARQTRSPTSWMRFLRITSGEIYTVPYCCLGSPSKSFDGDIACRGSARCSRFVSRSLLHRRASRDYLARSSFSSTQPSRASPSNRAAALRSSTFTSYGATRMSGPCESLSGGEFTRLMETKSCS
jgi:hypothetical protein